MLSEFEIIRRFFTHPTDPASGVVLGVGDDAALVKPTAGMELAISTDMLVADRHFLPIPIHINWVINPSQLTSLIWRQWVQNLVG